MSNSESMQDCLGFPYMGGTIHQASVVQRLDISAIHRINLNPVDSAISFPNTYPLDSDLSGR